jgi:hypothetical protein
MDIGQATGKNAKIVKMDMEERSEADNGSQYFLLTLLGQMDVTFKKIEYFAGNLLFFVRL